MPVIIQRKEKPPDYSSISLINVGTLDLTNGLTIELTQDIFVNAGTWYLINYGTILGSVNNITINNSTTFTSGSPYIRYKTVIIELT